MVLTYFNNLKYFWLKSNQTLILNNIRNYKKNLKKPRNFQY